MKIKTSELIDVTLDWAVLAALQRTGSIDLNKAYKGSDGRLYLCGYGGFTIDYSKWEAVGPIIDQEGILNGPSPFPHGEFAAGIGSEWSSCKCISVGPTPLAAAMRCFVTFKMGDEVDVPGELVAEHHSAPVDDASPINAKSPK